MPDPLHRLATELGERPPPSFAVLPEPVLERLTLLIARARAGQAEAMDVVFDEIADAVPSFSRRLVNQALNR
ncbi:hypothetical protein [Nocardia brasiliensis]|uniref:hypothetical protein n=1 Tax=Nocardia brasiliensis TaxID=37326 RepID=UPI003D8F4346